MTKPVYFDYFPTIDYQVDRNSNNSFVMRNTMLRSKVLNAVLNNDDAFFPFRLRDFDRPDTIADKYYGSSEYYWVVFFSNNAFDLYYDFPMDRRTFDKYLIDKYSDTYSTATETFFSGVMGAPGNFDDRLITYLSEVVHHYEDSDGFIVDKQTYDLDTAGSRREVSIYDYEFELNERKREIKLLDVRLLNQIVSEVEDSLNA